MWKRETGKTYNDLTVLGRGGRGLALCLCVCGKETRQHMEAVRKGIIKSCGCRRIFHANKVRIRHGMASVEGRDLRYTLWIGAKGRAADSGCSFTIQIEDIVIPDTCPVFGIPLFQGKKKAHENSPSLDRIDNSKGYEPGNVKVICWRANRLKHNLTKEEVFALGRYMEGETGGTANTLHKS